MIMGSWLRKLLLTAHVSSSVGLLGAITCFLALSFIGLLVADEMTMRSAYVASGALAALVIVPFAFAALLTGIVQALGTSWGLLRHYWVLTKLLLTVLVIAVLLMQLGGIGHLAEMAAGQILAGADHFTLRLSMSLHAAGGFAVLLVIIALSVYKPRGLTRYGWRKVHEERFAGRDA